MKKDFPETEVFDIVIITAAAILVAFAMAAIIGEMTGHVDMFIAWFGV
jgi:hypothetical protein